MANLRKLVDALLPSVSQVKPKTELKPGDQAVVKQSSLLGHAQTKELVVGTVVSLPEDGQGAIVSMPRPGGRMERRMVPLNQLSPVSDFYKRAAVHSNPAMRGIFKNSV